MLKTKGNLLALLNLSPGLQVWLALGARLFHQNKVLYSLKKLFSIGFMLRQTFPRGGRMTVRSSMKTYLLALSPVDKNNFSQAAIKNCPLSKSHTLWLFRLGSRTLFGTFHWNVTGFKAYARCVNQSPVRRRKNTPLILTGIQSCTTLMTFLSKTDHTCNGGSIILQLKNSCHLVTSELPEGLQWPPQRRNVVSS